MQRIHKNNKEFKCVRLFPDGGYFISDSEGTGGKNIGMQLSKELKHGGKDPILDVAVAGDGAWIVVRPQRFVTSRGVNSELRLKVSKLYSTHQSRQKLRSNAIKAYDTRVQREKDQRERDQQEAADRAAKAQREKDKREEEQREAAERKRRNQGDWRQSD
jgi:hypothetical protein